MLDSKYEAELVDRLRRAYECISDILVYSPEYMHGSPKTDYSEALREATEWLEARYDRAPMKAYAWEDMDKIDDRLL